MEQLAVKHALVLELKQNAAKLTAMTASVTGTDSFRVGDTWFKTDDGLLRPGLVVDEVNHYGRHGTEVGDALTIHDLNRVNYLRVLVTKIEMNVPEQMSDDEFRAMGFADAAEFIENEQVNPKTQKWFIHYELLEVHIAA